MIAEQRPLYCCLFSDCCLFEDCCLATGKYIPQYYFFFFWKPILFSIIPPVYKHEKKKQFQEWLSELNY
jgi:hypothetical protein